MSLNTINTLKLYHVQCFASGFYPLTPDFSVSSLLLRGTAVHQFSLLFDIPRLDAYTSFVQSAVAGQFGLFSVQGHHE